MTIINVNHEGLTAEVVDQKTLIEVVKRCSHFTVHWRLGAYNEVKMEAACALEVTPTGDNTFAVTINPKLLIDQKILPLIMEKMLNVAKNDELLKRIHFSLDWLDTSYESNGTSFHFVLSKKHFKDKQSEVEFLITCASGIHRLVAAAKFSVSQEKQPKLQLLTPYKEDVR